MKNLLKQPHFEMEHHAFFRLVEDYEDLGGNDYVHSVVVPEVNELMVIPMSDTVTLKKLYDSRNIAKFEDIKR